ncbi:hypothetical protein HDU97_009262, partial [Phlyctochytrium planicorne]
MPFGAVILPSRITHQSSTPIGRGGFGEVFKARYHGEPVAIKRSKTPASLFDKAVKDEVTMLSKLSHPRIVRFYGAVIADDGSLGLVLENDKIRWALDVAYGLQHLHEHLPPIIHRDLKSPNVLMSVEKGSLCAKVSDFGSAIMHISRTSQMSSKAQNLTGTTRFYQAPELNAIKVTFTMASDIYAYGIVLSEIISWEGPFGCGKQNMNYNAIDWCISMGQPIPFSLDEFDVPKDFKQLCTKCAGLKDSRPSIQEVIDSLSLLPDPKTESDPQQSDPQVLFQRRQTPEPEAPDHSSQSSSEKSGIFDSTSTRPDNAAEIPSVLALESVTPVFKEFDTFIPADGVPQSDADGTHRTAGAVLRSSTPQFNDFDVPPSPARESLTTDFTLFNTYIPVNAVSSADTYRVAIELPSVEINLSSESEVLDTSGPAGADQSEEIATISKISSIREEDSIEIASTLGIDSVKGIKRRGLLLESLPNGFNASEIVTTVTETGVEQQAPEEQWTIYLQFPVETSPIPLNNIQ